MFIDGAKINLRAGSGGKGCQSIYRDKYQRQGIPDGGDGGKGADIIIRADHNLLTLLDFQYHRHFFGAHGGHGSSNHKKGRSAEDVIIRVPLGTTIKNSATGSILRDLEVDGDQVIVARGGQGGVGNWHRKEATPGEAGEEKIIELDLKLLADVAVVGFPNAGKSTLISAISNAHPKIAAYPFTTTGPILGVAQGKHRKFVIADIPGLISGASAGRGLGIRFLKHIERTKILIHLVDMAGFEGRDPLEDYKNINLELKNYSWAVYKKPQVICANKMDLPGAAENLKRFKKTVKKTIYPVSALNRQGLEELVDAVAKKI
ncbi:MAG: GTPase ObgE [Candidatus Omnitrophica bacterium CG11_big_fil_rev_8_21_14_0_20_43_6]|nr:MAG: GTPase ObgE [Candidatus Omnitrophica bacterium CG11_big_fil_rev_8_21_14_0_20_43_6]